MEGERRGTGRDNRVDWKHMCVLLHSQKYAFQLDGPPVPPRPCTLALPCTLITINVVNAFCPVGATAAYSGGQGGWEGEGESRNGIEELGNIALSDARCLLYVRVFLFIQVLRFLFYLFISLAPRK